LILNFILRSNIGQKHQKISKFLKNLLPQNHKCQNWTKSSFIISKKFFLKFVRGNFLWPIFFRLCYRQCIYVKSQFECSITSLLLVLEQKIVLTVYKKSYPRNRKMFSNLTFHLNFKVKLRSICWFYTTNVCKSVPVVAIKFIFIIYDCCNTY
jgi:hypothetical protein